jgi:hypothetical protein
VERERCSWCGESVSPDDGFRVAEPAGERRAAFCRLEHVVPWAIRGSHWDPGAVDEPVLAESPPERCSNCDAELPDTAILLVRHRGEHRIPDGFCSVDHLREWAQAGGRWRA